MVAVKYMLLIYSSPESWAGLSAAQREALARDHAALTEELADQGLLVSSAGLADPITSRTVSVRDGSRAFEPSAISAWCGPRQRWWRA